MTFNRKSRKWCVNRISTEEDKLLFKKKNQTEILELKSTITENKKFTGGFNSRIEQREEKEISELEDN